MPLISVPNHISPFQLEVPADVERSVKGALHIKPGTLHLTADEWAHVELHASDFAKQVTMALPEDHAPAISE